MQKQPLISCTLELSLLWGNYIYIFTICRCLKLLLDHGASPNHGDNNSWTALHLAATEGHIECCHLLLEHGAKLNSISNVSLQL